MILETARVSLALSAASEQRVVTALFVGFAPWATGDGGAGREPRQVRTTWP